MHPKREIEEDMNEAKVRLIKNYPNSNTMLRFFTLESYYFNNGLLISN